jgi:hypothetical protein
MTNPIITKQTLNNQTLVVSLDGTKIVITLDGEIVPNKKNAIEPVDFKGKRGLGNAFVVGGTTILTVEEGQELTAAYKAARTNEAAQNDAEWRSQQQAQREEYIRSGAVRLQKHQYGETEWYLCYGSLQDRIYPVMDITPDRPHDENYISGVRWQLDLAEYSVLAKIPTIKPVKQYDLTEPKGMPVGVNEILKAQDALHRAESEYERAHEREEIAPYPSNKDYREAIAAYPRAALYLTCEEYIAAAHDLKATAGEKAQKLLLDGGKPEDIQAILDNWLPPSAMWD